MNRAAAVFAAALFVPAAAGAIEFEPRLSIARPAPDARTVALTLDACSGGFDQRVMDALVESNAKATIFVTERWLTRNPQALAALKARSDLFQVENHGARHVPAITDASSVFGVKTALTLDGVRKEVEGGARAVEAATGRRPQWYRGATARYTPDALKEIAALGYRVAGYSLNADQGASLGARETARRIKAAKSGDVVIAHINQPGRPAGAGVAAGVMALAAEGVRFVRLDEVETRGDDGRPRLSAGYEVEHELGVQGDDHGRDQSGQNGHPARGDELAHLGPARGEPDQRNHGEGQLKAQHDLAQHQ